MRIREYTEADLEQMIPICGFNHVFQKDWRKQTGAKVV